MRSRWLAPLVLTLLPWMATAQTPRLLGVQGRLENSVGQALTGPQDLTFKIYTASTGGTQIASETETVPLDDDGVYAATIGDTDVLDPADFAAELWLGVTVDLAGGGSELTPRIPLRAAAGSLRAAVAEGVDAEADLVMNGRKITGLAAPMADGDAVPRGYVGDLAGLSTATQATLVAAVNEVDGDVGAPASLNTTDKSNLVAAINELLGVIQAQQGVIATLDARVADLETKTAAISISPGEPGTNFNDPYSLAGDIILSGVNLHLRNGSGTTTGGGNGRGNLVVGYNENSIGDETNRGGSHNIAVGIHHRYTSHSGIVTGQGNDILNQAAAILGGLNNEVAGYAAGILGGAFNDADGPYSGMVGGQTNTTGGSSGAVVGGNGQDTGANDFRTVLGNTGNAFVAADGVLVDGALDSLEATVGSLETTAAIVLAKTAPLAISTGESGTTTGDLMIVGVNVHVRSGAGTTSTTNGLGNLVLGYNDGSPADLLLRGGSHNLVVGDDHYYDAWAGVVSGQNNGLLGPAAAVIGGEAGSADAAYAVVLGGQDNEAVQQYSVVVGGDSNTASGTLAAVLGGRDLTASGQTSVAVGGRHNIAAGADTLVAGGGGATAGFGNRADGQFSVVSGGQENITSGAVSVIVGGENGSATGVKAGVFGGFNNTASGLVSVTVGGQANDADGYASSISGGLSNTASGDNASVAGGANNHADPHYSSILGGVNNTLSGSSYQTNVGDASGVFVDGTTSAH